MDDDGSKHISLAEFKKAMTELSVGLTDRDARLLFDSFDMDGSGSISFEELLQALTLPMNERRMGFVRMAFNIMDKDGSGTIEPHELLDSFNASQHPDVLSGHKTPTQVLNGFLETFEVGGVVDGKVTFEEFVNYYQRVSSSIDDDDYFELMMRNAWHISGGEGWCANSSNRRVLATMPDGSQKVVELHNDLGIKADDNAQIFNRLRSEGTQASSVDLSFSSEPSPRSRGAPGQGPGGIGRLTGSAEGSPAASLNDPVTMPPLGKSAPNVVTSSRRGRTTGMHNTGDMSASPGTMPGTAAPRNERDPSPLRNRLGARSTTSNRRATGAAVPSEVDVGLRPIVAQVKAELARRGARGIHGLGRRFRAADDDGSRSLNLAEFKKAMTETGLGLTDVEMRLLFSHFDVDGNSSVDFEEFLQALRDPLSDRRKALIAAAFSIIDKDGSGVVEPADIMGVYDTSKHPDVIKGTKTPDQVLAEFLETFEVGGEVDGKVTYQEFTNYYHNVSSSIDDDDYFELMMRNAWHISGGEGWCANSSNRRVLVTHADGKQTVEEIPLDLGLRADDKEGMLRHLSQRKGISASSIDLFGGGDFAPGRRKLASDPAKISHFAGAPPVKKGLHDSLVTNANSSGWTNNPNQMIDQISGINDGYGGAEVSGPRSSSRPSARATSALDRAAAADVGMAQVVTSFRRQLAARGVTGIVSMGRKFRAMCDNGLVKTLKLFDFKTAIKEMQLALTDREITGLFKAIDEDDSGSIDFEEFLHAVRGPMSPRRLDLIQQAFTKLDKDGSGVVEPAEILGVYDTSKHPDVIKGTKTPDQVLAEFLETFEVGSTEKDGKVTYQEFEQYYSNVSSSIDDDDYFELMMRNAWHISGGEGWCANSSNKRVLVTHADGKQTVEEVKNDLGVKADDKATLAERLRAQGTDAASISLKDSLDTTQGAGAGPTAGGVPAGTHTTVPHVRPMAERKHPNQFEGVKDIHRSQMGSGEELPLTSGKHVSAQRARDFESHLDLALGGEADQSSAEQQQPWEPIGHRKKAIKNTAHNSTLASLSGGATVDGNASNSIGGAGGGGAGGGGGDSDPYANRVDPVTGQATSQRMSPSKEQAMKAMGLVNGRVSEGPARGGALATLADHALADPDIDAKAILRRFRAQLSARGVRGIVGLGRAFRIMDLDGTGSLTLHEFQIGLNREGFNASEKDVSALFKYIDSDHSGRIDYDELLRAIRGPMAERRIKLVDRAFDIMDKDGNGCIEPSEVMDCYDTSKHPDVMSGKKTPQEVLTEFLETFEVGGEKDGRVTRNEFRNYYHNVSSSIDNDDYFELMMRNAWHISGGEGWCANSSNRRVLVTHTDGHQSVEEVKNDIGIAADNRVAIEANLRAQGINDSTGFKMSSMIDDTKPATRRRMRPTNTFSSTLELS